jgi:hypothetical protein
MYFFFPCVNSKKTIAAHHPQPKTMPHDRRKHRRTMRAERNAGESRNIAKHKHSESDECVKVCGAATLSFVLSVRGPACVKRYFYINTSVPPHVGSNDESSAFANKSVFALVAPINATSLSIAWTFVVGFPGRTANNLTRCIISVERDAGCKLEQITKFRIPVSLVPQNDCECAERLVPVGVSHSVPVKICAGDLIFVSATKFLAENCLVKCGVPVADPTPPDDLDAFKLLVCLS